MGKKKRKDQKFKKGCNDNFSSDAGRVDFDEVMLNITAKDRSKLSKKMRKKARKEKQRCEKYKSDDNKTTTAWDQVKVEVMTNISKEFLLTSIGSYVDTPFVCLGFHKIGTNISFYLDRNKEVASAISGLNRRIQSPDGEAMKINVSPVNIPQLVLNSNQLLVLRDVIAKRFDLSTGLLDLTCLYLDSTLLEKDIFVPLNSPLVFKQVLRIIKENISNLNALNLSKNKMQNESIKLLQSLHSSPCSLTALNLEGNNIVSLQFLKYLNMFPIKELNFSNNQVQKDIEDPFQQLKFLVKELPNLKMVDGIDIDSYGPTCAERIERSIKLKPSPLNTASSSLQSSLPSMTDGHLRTFLDQFYKLYDSHGRPDLWAAYTPLAKFDLTSHNPIIPSKLYDGQQEIQQFLSSFPETHHIHSSFNLEILGVTSSEGLAKITGSCRVNGLLDPLIFERTMKIIPFNSGFCCSLDSLIIR